MMVEVQTLLGEMQTLQKDAEIARKRKTCVVAGSGRSYPGYTEALERRVISLEEENRVLRQRDVMHRMIGLSEEGGEGGSAGAAGAPQLVHNLSKSNLATFEPFQLDVAKLDATGGASSARAARAGAGTDKSARKWGMLRVLMSFGTFSNKVHPIQARPNRAAKYHPKPRPVLSSLSGTAKQAWAVTVIQSRWRGRMTRDELYWEMMGY